MQNTTIIKFIGLFLLLTISFALSLFYGGSETIALENSTATDFIFWQIRWPKSTTAVLAGSSLAISGLILQILFRNPLAGPYVLGISSGASLLVAISIMAGTTLQLPFSNFFGKSVLALSAMTGSFLVTLLVLAASKKINSNVVLLIIGLMFSQICGAVQSALEYFADPSSVKIVVVWGMGSLGSTSGYDFLFLFLW